LRIDPDPVEEPESSADFAEAAAGEAPASEGIMNAEGADETSPDPGQEGEDDFRKDPLIRNALDIFGARVIESKS